MFTVNSVMIGERNFDDEEVYKYYYSQFVYDVLENFDFDKKIWSKFPFAGGFRDQELTDPKMWFMYQFVVNCILEFESKKQEALNG